MRLVYLTVAALLAAGPVLAADGKALFEEKGCNACHGDDAATPLDKGYPKLAGQKAVYAVNQLKDIKSGARANGLIPDTMKAVVEDLPEADMVALAAYIETLPAKPAAKPGNPTKIAEGKKLYMTKTCIACHGREGGKPIQAYPKLAGQEKSYLLAQMKDIQSGKRANGASNAMQPVMHLTSDKEKDAIAEFLANVK